MKIIVAVTGASGVILAKNLLEELTSHKKYSRYVIISDSAKKICKYEDTSVSEIKDLADRFYSEKDIEAEIASSSSTVKMDAMVVMPCSMKTLSAIANGLCDNLITRCAENMLKFNQKLVVVPRDTPLSLPAIENMKKVKLAGGVIVPPNMAYYYKPGTLQDVNNFFVGKVLDALNIDHNLYPRWKYEEDVEENES